MQRPSSARNRSAIREFARQHHPDVGGDPEVFAAGLAELRARERADDRFDAPVVGVPRVRGLRGVAQRWRARRGRAKRRRVL